jgi:hypothetical protein
MTLFAIFKSAGPTGFGYGSMAEQVTEGLSLAGQTILVTGCNSGHRAGGVSRARPPGRPGAGDRAYQGEGRGGRAMVQKFVKEPKGALSVPVRLGAG